LIVIVVAVVVLGASVSNGEWAASPSVASGVAAFPITAMCTLQPDGGSGVTGSISFLQNSDGAPVIYNGTIKGLKDGNHGFHVHQSGDISKGCATAGAHFNPYNRTHGAPYDHERHVGDLGNIGSEGSLAYVHSSDRSIQLAGPNSIIGRAVVVHADFDDLGRGGFPDSKTTGHAGARLACCVIGIME